MLVNSEEILNKVIEEMEDVMKIRSSEIPNIDLYMDQVRTFMDDKLKFTLRGNDDEEKILTKTMINNYAKNDVLPPPVKKKYTKEHMMILIFIYYFKNFLTINDINILIKPLCDKYFGGQSEIALDDIYSEVFGVGGERMSHLKDDLEDKYRASLDTFTEAPEEDREYLQLFSYICFLSYDVFVKKLLIERLIDELEKKEPVSDKEGKDMKDKKDKDGKDKDKKDKDKKDKDKKDKDSKDKDKKEKKDKKDKSKNSQKDAKTDSESDDIPGRKDKLRGYIELP